LPADADLNMKDTMSEPSSPGIYTLTVLSRLLGRFRSLPEIRTAVDTYPEDTRREGPVRADMAEYVSRFSTFDQLDKAVQTFVASQGGPDALDDLQNRMDSDEFMAGQ
jgi:hypothetical protein